MSKKHKIWDLKDKKHRVKKGVVRMLEDLEQTIVDQDAEILDLRKKNQMLLDQIWEYKAAVRVMMAP